MSTLKVNNLQVGQSATATNNFTLYQPSTPDGTVRLGYGNVGAATDVLRVTSTGRLGIGTTPSYLAHAKQDGNVYATVAIDNATAGTSSLSRFLALSNAGSASFGMTSSSYTDVTGAQDACLINTSGSSGGIVFAQEGVFQAKIDSTGNVGIGTTTPVNYSNQRSLTVWGSSVGRIDVLGGAGNGGQLYATESEFVAFGGYATPLVLRGGTTSYLSIGNGATESLRVASSGNIGIGTTNPFAKLDVYENNGSGGNPSIQVRNDATNTSYASLFVTAGTTTLQIYSDAAGNSITGGVPASVIRATSNTALLLGTNNTERVRITSTGNVGIGTTNPSVKLQVEGILNTKGGAVHEVYDLLNINPAGTGFDRLTNDSDGGGTSWQVVGSRVVDLFSTSGAHGGQWGFPVRIDTSGWYRWSLRCRLSSTNGYIHPGTPASNYKYNIRAFFDIGGVTISSGVWDVDTLGNGARVARLGATGYLASGTYQPTYNTSGYEGIKQLYIYGLELIRVG